jgi:cytochrome c-type biogenesis protein CcmH/NrfG
MTRKVVFETAEVQAIFSEKTSDFLLISFAHATMPANGWRFFGANLADRHMVSTLGFVATRANWYPAADMGEAIQAIRPILNRFGERVCIGYSMGGYATIKYARLLGSDTSIALSPQYSVHPSDIPDEFEDDLKETMAALKVDRDCIDEDMRIAAESGHGRIYAFYDNTLKADSTHIARIEAQVRLIKVTMPYRRHFLDRCFAETPALSRLVKVCRTGSEAAVRALARERRKMGSLRAFNVGCELADRHLRWGIALLERHASRMELRERTELSNRLAAAAIDRGDFAWPVAALEHLLNQQAADADSYALLATAYLNLGNLPRAASALRQRVQLVPGDADAWEKLTDTLLRMKDLSGSLDEIANAIRHCPDRTDLLYRASDIAQSAGRTEDAISYLRRAITAQTPPPSRVKKLAFLLFEAEHYDEADAYFDWYLRLRSDTCHPQLLMGDTPDAPPNVTQIRTSQLPELAASSTSTW